MNPIVEKKPNSICELSTEKPNLMIPIKIVEKKPNSIFYELPAGKPNPKESCPTGVDTRGRVIQKANKGSNTCFYDAMNRIRMRIGKCSGEEFQEQREIEILGSKWLKSCISLQKSLPKLVDTYNSESDRKYHSYITLEMAKKLLESKNPQIYTKFDGRPSLSVLYEEFVQENKHKNFLVFLEDKLPKKEIAINKKLIENFAEHKYLKDLEKTFEEKGIKDTLEASIKYHYLACLFLAQAYDLPETQWTPFMDIDSLIKELTQKGPLAIGGKFGKQFYIEKPVEENINGRKICSWQQGAKRIDIGGHEIIIVGAKKVNDSALVYFIDPSEESDPDQPALQKYYKISYKNLTTNIINVYGRADNQKEMLYGFHGHFNHLNS